jgi:Protein of unknown function (DUF1565)
MAMQRRQFIRYSLASMRTKSLPYDHYALRTSRVEQLGGSKVRIAAFLACLFEVCAFPQVSVRAAEQVCAPCYVSTTGDDENEGSLERPFRTIQFALNRAKPGSTVFVRGGVYDEQLTFPTGGNKADGYVTLENFPKEVPHVRPKKLATRRIYDVEVDFVILIHDQSYIRIRGLEVSSAAKMRNGAGIGAVGTWSHLELISNTVHDCKGPGGRGIGASGNSKTPSGQLLVRSNEVYRIESDDSEAVTFGGNIDGIRIENNVVRDCNCIGIDVTGGYGGKDVPYADKNYVRNGTIVGNTVFNNGPGGRGIGIYNDGARDMLIECNRVYENAAGIDIRTECGWAKSERVVVRNNLVYRNAFSGLAVGFLPGFAGDGSDGGEVNDCRILHNMVGGNGHDRTIHRFHANVILGRGTSVEMANNIFISTTGGRMIYEADPAHPKMVLQSNLYFTEDGKPGCSLTYGGKKYDDFANFQKASGQESGGLFADPKFVAASTFRFTLKADSPAIGGGSQAKAHWCERDFGGTVRPKGKAADIGPYQCEAGGK